MARSSSEVVKGKEGEGDGSSRCDLEREGGGKTERLARNGRGRGKHEERKGARCNRTCM